MHRICQRNGFAQSSHVFELHIAETKPGAPLSTNQDRARLIPVDTLSYEGLWLEGELSQAAIDAGFSALSRGSCTRMGAVVDKNAVATSALLRANGFEIVGEYHWWTAILQSG